MIGLGTPIREKMQLTAEGAENAEGKGMSHRQVRLITVADCSLGS